MEEQDRSTIATARNQHHELARPGTPKHLASPPADQKAPGIETRSATELALIQGRHGAPQL